MTRRILCTVLASLIRTIRWRNATKNRSATFAALSCAFLAAPSAFAQTSGAMPQMSCSDASMTKANVDMMKMADADKKVAAMKEMDMAKDMMAMKDGKGCMMHLEKAISMMK